MASARGLTNVAADQHLSENDSNQALTKSLVTGLVGVVSLSACTTSPRRDVIVHGGGVIVDSGGCPTQRPPSWPKSKFRVALQPDETPPLLSRRSKSRRHRDVTRVVCAESARLHCRTQLTCEADMWTRLRSFWVEKSFALLEFAGTRFLSRKAVTKTCDASESFRSVRRARALGAGLKWSRPPCYASFM